MFTKYSLPLLLITTVFLISCSSATLSKDECLIADWQLIGFGDGSTGKANTQLNKHREACNKHSVNPDKALYDIGYAEGNTEYCTNARGYQQASNGYGSHQVCQYSNVYNSGHKQGVIDYCVYERGYEEGGKGQLQKQICSASQPYLDGYSQGIPLYCNYTVGYELGLNNDRINACPVDLEADFLLGYEEGQYVSQLFSDLRYNERAIENLAEEYDQLQIKTLDVKNKIAYNEALTSDDRVKLLNQLERLTEREEEIETEITQANANIADIQYGLGAMGVSY